MTGIHEVVVDPESILTEIVVDPGWFYCHDTGHAVMVYHSELVAIGDYPDAHDLIHEGNYVLVAQEFFEDEDMVGIETTLEVYMKGD